MGDLDHMHNELIVPDFINDTVGALPDTVKFLAGKLFTPRGSGIFCKGINPSQNFSYVQLR